ncbi:MAG: TorF family putative porin [Candidatus Margulisbacteria bacterium]|nr:TorF family putative porin [Candidatus Margulisiibacteriota bacterium]
MRNKIRLLGGLVVGLLVLSSVAYGNVVDYNLAYVSKYIWRGQDQDSGQPALQPGVTLYLGETGLSIGAWGNYNIGDSYVVGLGGPVVNKEFTEIDYTLTYASQFNDDWTYSVYLTQYNYPPGEYANTAELFLNLTARSWPFTPTLTYSYDNDKGKGAYVSLAGKNSFNAGSLKIDGSLTAGYDNGQYNVTPGFSDATLALSTAIPVNQLTLTPTVNYTVVGKETRPTSENVFWFSLNIAGGF